MDAEGSGGGHHARSPVAERILDAAERLFAAKGIGGTGIRAVAAEAGVTVTTLYRHVGSKEGLVSAVMRRNPATLAGLYPDALPPCVEERVRTLALNHFARLEHRRAIVRIITQEGLFGGPDSVAVLDELAEAWLQRWITVLATSADLRPGADVEPAALVIRQALWGMTVAELSNPGRYPLERAIGALAQVVSESLRCPDAPAPRPARARSRSSAAGRRAAQPST